ncbi:zf-TFIIB domain-containing protein [Legionella yabuuchiae]|uniref:TFIIB-type zinc ribbon-containing protein n=1 Tax=Legionella yabuuchiae TaxID=376727 RepID=UPI001056CB3D|nr:zf-TFIIB domain-containing protein [Legionella yabuuchiae]
MKCPVCPDSVLQMSDRQGVEIDYCPNCRGIWLDRGELDKIIEKEQQFLSRSSEKQERYEPDYRKHGQKKKKSSFLGDLFDF